MTKGPSSKMVNYTVTERQTSEYTHTYIYVCMCVCVFESEYSIDGPRKMFAEFGFFNFFS